MSLVKSGLRIAEIASLLQTGDGVVCGCRRAYEAAEPDGGGSGYAFGGEHPEDIYVHSIDAK